MRRCKKCGVEKEEREFRVIKSGRSKGYVNPTCKSCHAAVVLKWRKANLERYAASVKNAPSRDKEIRRKLFRESGARKKANLTDSYVRGLLRESWGSRKAVPTVVVEVHRLRYLIAKETSDEKHRRIAR